MRILIAVAAAMAAFLGSSSPTRADESAEDFVRRMAEAGRPDLAESRAKDVLDVDLAEPVSTAVVAAMRARRGDAEGAVSGIATAVVYGADEPFVRRTAGQILAWHDTRSGSMADDIETSLETMRHAVDGTPECAEAYRIACDAYVAARASPAASPRPDATLIPDSVEAEFAGDADSDPVIFASAAASCGVWWNCATPECRAELCSTLVRSCGARPADGRVSWGRRGASSGRVSGTWSTPLGTFSRSVRTSGYCAPAAAAPSCAPASCEETGGHRRR
jgi:hypothetical protein